jgi:hypothetical protein
LPTIFAASAAARSPAAALFALVELADAVGAGGGVDAQLASANAKPTTGIKAFTYRMLLPGCESLP